MPPKLSAHPAPKAQAPKPDSAPDATQSTAPEVPTPEPVKVPLENSVRKTVEVRRDVLTAELRKENELEVKREEEVRKGRETIATLEADIAELEAFLARN